MKIAKQIISFVIIFFSLISCINSKSRVDDMRLTSQELLNYLFICDTLNIYKLYGSEKNLDDAKDRVSEDCKLYKKISTLYGKPSQDQMILSKGENEEDIVSIKLLDKADTALNLKECELIIFFYPEKFATITSTKKILNYIIFKSTITKPEHKLIIGPTLSKKN